MMFFSKNKAERKYKFKPKKDLSAYELSVLLNLSAGVFYVDRANLSDEDRKAIARHLVEIK